MILVTGATGLVGSHLVKELAKTNSDVVALYNKTKPSAEQEKLATWKQIDILDIVALEEAMIGVKQVYHCAAMVSFNAKDKNQIHHLNIEGTKNVVNTCLNNGIEKLVHVSSVATLDRFKDGDLINERMQGSVNDKENSEYAKSKTASEMEIWRAIGEGLNAVIVNPSIILGAGNWNNSSTAIFKNCYNEFPWHTNGSNGFVDVEDVVKAMIGLMNSNISNERFIVSGWNLSYKELFDTVAKNFNKKQPSKLATPFLSAIAWRVEKLKSLFTGKNPLLTKETARTAQKKIAYDNAKLLKALPVFTFGQFENTVHRICNELKAKYNL